MKVKFVSFIAFIRGNSSLGFVSISRFFSSKVINLFISNAIKHSPTSFEYASLEITA